MDTSNLKSNKILFSKTFLLWFLVYNSLSVGLIFFFSQLPLQYFVLFSFCVIISNNIIVLTMVTREVSRLFEILKTSNEDLLINQTLLKQEQSKLKREKKNEVEK